MGCLLVILWSGRRSLRVQAQHGARPFGQAAFLEQITEDGFTNGREAGSPFRRTAPTLLVRARHAPPGQEIRPTPGGQSVIRGTNGRHGCRTQDRHQPSSARFFGSHILPRLYGSQKYRARPGHDPPISAGCRAGRLRPRRSICSSRRKMRSGHIAINVWGTAPPRGNDTADVGSVLTSFPSGRERADLNPREARSGPFRLSVAQHQRQIHPSRRA